MFVMICFALSWLPIIVTQFIPSSLLSTADITTMKFAFMWLGIGGSSSKILIFFFINPEFRRTFCALSTGVTATASSESASYASLDFIPCCIPEERSCLSSLCCCLLCGCCICFRKACCKAPPSAMATSTTYYANNNRRIDSPSPMEERVSGPMLASSSNPNNFVNSRFIPEYGSFSRYATEGYS